MVHFKAAKLGGRGMGKNCSISLLSIKKIAAKMQKALIYGGCIQFLEYFYTGNKFHFLCPKMMGGFYLRIIIEDGRL